MRLYFDASVLVALVVYEDRSQDARALIAHHEPPIVSSFAALEMASAISRKVRMGELSTLQADDALTAFDVWLARDALQVITSDRDVFAAAGLVRRYNLKLRTGDALHVTTAFRLGRTLRPLMQKWLRRLGPSASTLKTETR